MSLLVRAVVARSDAAVGAGVGLTAVVEGRVAALVSADRAPTAPDRARLLEHHAVVQSVFERAGCLPARYGTFLPDERTLGMRLAEREDKLAGALARIGARGELAITCAWRDEGRDEGKADVTEADATPTGRAYLERGLDRARARRAREDRAREIAVRLLAELPIEPAFVRHEACPRPAVAVSMAALVTMDEAEAIRTRLARLEAALPDVTTIVQGPWAPYTFASVL